MDLFSKITISHFIWYLVPGLAAFFLIIFPFFLFIPKVTENILTAFGPVGIILLCITLGFLLDGLRLYRLKCDYNKIKNLFFIELQRIVGKKIDPYLIQSNIVDIAREKNVPGLSFHHAIWILHGHISLLFIIEGISWLIYSLYIFLFGKEKYLIVATYELENIQTGFLCIILMLLFIMIGSQIMKISTEDQINTNNMFLDFARQHKNELKSILNISD